MSVYVNNFTRVILTYLFYPGIINLMETLNTYTAFEDHKILSKGSLEDVVLKVKKRFEKSPASQIVIYSDATGKSMDFNFHGSEKEVLKRLEVYTTPESATAVSSGPGRPKLGVISREVSLLPKHWEWLATQSGGASNTLRKLVEESMKKTSGVNTVKTAQERTYKFMSVEAGDLENYEEALRALYRKDKERFSSEIKTWPRDVQKHIIELSKAVFA